MCGRTDTPKSDLIVKELKLFFSGDPVPARINTGPTDRVPVVTNDKPNELQYKVWSLIPWFSKTGKADPKMSTFNARRDKLMESAMWKPLLGKKHCVFITNGFYEWNWLDEKGKKKQPYLIRSVDEPFTYMAGLWEDWTNKETGEIISSCSIITNDANEMMAKIHNTKARMPAFVTWETAKIWLDNEISVTERLKAIEPVHNEFLRAVPINKVGDESEYANLQFC